MRSKDTFEVYASMVAVLADAAAVICGLMAATWIRFRSGWFEVSLGEPPGLYTLYATAAAIIAPVFVLVYRSLGLYVRPQTSVFADKVPRLVRATAHGILIATAAAFIIRNRVEDQISAGVLILGFFTVSAAVLIQRAVLFHLEIRVASSLPVTTRVLILGTDITAAQITKALAQEPRLRSEVVGFLRTDQSEPDPDIQPDLIKGSSDDMYKFVEESNEADTVILTDPSLGHSRIVDMILMCERNLVSFKLVPDMFRILTSKVDVETIADVPILGVSAWPLDDFWSRTVKRLEDICGSIVGLVLSAPIIAAAIIAIKRTSPGRAFYAQERCGKGGASFTIYKLRTMHSDAEEESGPVWAADKDPRCTRVGSFLRRYNLDELPQLWNVLKGDMSLVGPRPERPHFVEQFKDLIGRYMSRHWAKPGITGWAQVNGLRGNTSLEERIKFDLYYVENWSLAFDFKILARSLFSKTGAY